MTAPTSPRDIDGRLDAVIANDPRVDERYVRLIDGGDSPVVLVGVVHDHPASVHRVETVIETLSPSSVAVELPDLLVSAFASTERTDEGVGGEMAAAIEAAGDRRVVGIDVPGRGTLAALVAALRSEDAAPRTTLRTVRSVVRMAGHAVVGRLAHAGLPGTPAVEDLETTHEYDLPDDATPTVQADHEAAHLRRSTTLLRAFRPPETTQVVDAAREYHMADRLDALRRAGLVVGVVGFGHLDGIETALQNETG